MKKTIQKFEDEYLDSLKSATPSQIAHWLEDYRKMMGSQKKMKSRSKLISIKIPEDMLESFKQKSKMQGIPYQTQIKRLMKEWLNSF